MKLQAIIFSVDGVLAETHEARREAFNAVFAEAGVAWTWSREVYAELLCAAPAGNMILAYINAHLPRWRLSDDILQLAAAMKRRQASIVREMLESGTVKLRPGIARFLTAAAQRGLRLAIATSERSTEVSRLLDANLGSTGGAVFEAVCAENEDGAPRDAHGAVLEALALEPESCLAIETSGRGLKSALRSGIPSVITWGRYPQLQDCAQVLSDASDRPNECVASMVLARWHADNPTELLARLTSLHAAKLCEGAVSSAHPAQWAIAQKEMDHAGLRHLEV